VGDEIGAVLERAALLREHAPSKPALLAEFGLATEKWGLSDSMKADEELVHFHNALWSSALSGVSGTAMFWWWEQLDRQNAYRHYRPLSQFLKDIPWTTGKLKPTSARVDNDAVHVVGLQGDDRLYLWLADRDATWLRAEEAAGEPRDIAGLTLEVDGLSPGSYTVEWWDTWEGSPLASERVRVADDPLRIAVPTFQRDIACRFEPSA